MVSSKSKIITARKKHKDIWLSMRAKLWPNHPIREHEAEINSIIKRKDEIAFLLFSGNNPAGFIECSIRRKAEGCKTNRVGYIEGWYVEEKLRKKGLGKKLVKVAEKWARLKGCKEMASDSEIKNERARKIHLALGYKEHNRLIHYRKDI